MRRLVLVALSLLAAGALHAEVIDIDTAELARLQAAGVAVVDVRTATEWDQTGVVPGSHLLTFFDAQGAAEPDHWLRKLRAIATPDQPVVVICHSGQRSRAVGRFLSGQAGYATVYNVDRGIHAWLGDRRAVVATGKAASSCARASTC